MSGCSYSRITFAESYEDEGCKEFINNCFKNLSNAGENHKFSMLFNAWTEQGFGKIFQNYKDSIYEIMADSGGLQIITQGLKVTDKIKNEVYDIQGKYANVGLSFDEIPLSFSGEKSSRNDIKDRWFEPDRFVECAKLTGRNVKNQIQSFLDMKTKTKPIYIVQGNDYDTYMRWAEIGLKEIPKEHHKYISGFAMAGPCLGTGALEDIKRAFYFTQLPINTRRLHLLGVGSVKRIAPFLIFSQSGLYNNLDISYDSTTHSSGVVMGRTYLNEKTQLFGREMNDVYEMIYKSIQKTPYFSDVSIETFHEIMNSASGVFKEKHGSRVPYIKTFIGFLSFTIDKFIKHMEKCFTSKDVIFKLAKNSKERNVFDSLYQIKNYDDFVSWEKNVGRSVISKKVSCRKIESTNIEELF